MFVGKSQHEFHTRNMWHAGPIKTTLAMQLSHQHAWLITPYNGKTGNMATADVSNQKTDTQLVAHLQPGDVI